MNIKKSETIWTENEEIDVKNQYADRKIPIIEMLRLNEIWM